MSTRILIVEDETDLGQILADYLTRDGFAASTQADGLLAMKELQRSLPDLLLLDLMLPGMDGLSILRELRKTSSIPVIVVTAKVEEIDRLIGLELGADDYLVKPFAFAELLARVRTLLRRGAAVIVESQFQVADLNVDLVSRKVSRSGMRITLTSKEFTLLEFFLRHQGEVLPRSLIASQVWDMNFDSDTNAIDVAVKRLRAKIDNDFEPKLIQTVRGVGYMLEVPDDQ